MLGLVYPSCIPTVSGRELVHKAATPLEQKRSFELGVVLASKYLPVMQI
jgi:hypothetical protein